MIPKEKPIWQPKSETEINRPLQPLNTHSRTTFILEADDAALRSQPTRKNKKKKFLRYQSSIGKGKGRVIKQTEVTTTYEPVTHEFVIYGETRLVKKEGSKKRLTSKKSKKKLRTVGTSGSRHGTRTHSRVTQISKRSAISRSKNSKNSKSFRGQDRGERSISRLSRASRHSKIGRKSASNSRNIVQKVTTTRTTSTQRSKQSTSQIKRTSKSQINTRRRAYRTTRI